MPKKFICWGTNGLVGVTHDFLEVGRRGLASMGGHGQGSNGGAHIGLPYQKQLVHTFGAKKNCQKE